MEALGHDLWHVCCGHDLVCILSIGLRRVLANYHEKEVAPEALERLLRVAYEPGHFKATNLCREIESWQQANQPYCVLDIA